MLAGVEGPADCIGINGVAATLGDGESYSPRFVGASGRNDTTKGYWSSVDVGFVWCCEEVAFWRRVVGWVWCCPFAGGGPVGCCFCGGIGLLEHAVRVVEGIFGYRVQWQIGMDNVRFGFVGRKPLVPFLT